MRSTLSHDVRSTLSRDVRSTLSHDALDPLGRAAPDLQKWFPKAKPLVGLGDAGQTMMLSALADTVRHRGRRLFGPRAMRPLRWLLATLLLGLYEFRTTVPSFRNSDDASNFLAGVEMAEGNWRLHGWTMAVDNYYPTDVLLQALLRLLFGLHPLFMQAAESAIWAAIGVLGIRLALHGPAAPSAIARVGILSLALSLLVFHVFEHEFRYVFLTSVASHGFTILLTLLAFTLVAGDDTAPTGHAARSIWRRSLPLGLVLTVGSVADPIFIVIACLPILATSLLELGPRRSRRLSLARIGTTVAALLLAHELLSVLVHNGGFQTFQVPLVFAGFSGLGSHLGFAIESISRLLGVELYGRGIELNGPVAITLLRVPLVLAFLIVCWEVGRETLQRARQWPSPLQDPPGGELDRLLWSSLVLDIAGTVMTSVIQDPTCARFFLPAAVTGSILIARRFGRAPLMALYGGVVLAASIVVAVRAVPQGTPASTIAIGEVQTLADILRRNGLRHGYAGYWEGAIVTALSHRQITSLALIGGGDGQLRTFDWFCNLDWYRQAARSWVGPVFVVVAQHADGIELGQDVVVRTFGPPPRTIPAGRFLIDVYQMRPGDLDRLQP